MGIVIVWGRGENIQMLRVPNSILVFPKFGLVLSARNWYLYDLIHCNRNRNRIRNRNQNLKSSMGRTLCNLR